ncbi:hypothetical protein [Streptomyces sp. NPDC047070]|uniref:hypothetical protein n=1 Tax=Streptomyces sp. NPDC047070 TaxID=3154923 RepID=UPI003451FDD6
MSRPRAARSTPDALRAVLAAALQDLAPDRYGPAPGAALDDAEQLLDALACDGWSLAVPHAKPAPRRPH